jgi:hypothetical protein
MTNVNPIITPDDEEDWCVAHSLMRDIREMLKKDIIPKGNVVNVGVIRRSEYEARMVFLIDDGDVYTVCVDLAGDALDMAEDIAASADR